MNNFVSPLFKSLASSLTLVRFSTKEQTFFAKRLSFLVKAGVPLVECLNLIRTQTKSAAKQRVFDAVIADVLNGQYLSTSLAKRNGFFGDFSVQLIRVGEESGILSQNLIYLADELQKKQALERKVLAALAYPMCITLATLGITAVLTAYIFPKLMPIFTSLGVELPATTRALIGVSSYLQHYGIVTTLTLIALITALIVIRRRVERVRLWGDRFLLYIPIVGAVVRAYNLTSFCRTLGLLLRSGITLPVALSITAKTTKNRSYRLASAHLATIIAGGESLSHALAARRDLYPDILTHLIAVGEKTGNLSTSLIYLGELYEDDVDALTKGLSNAIEPVLMIVMGLLVGLVAVSVIMPIYEITQHLRPS